MNRIAIALVVIVAGCSGTDGTEPRSPVSPEQPATPATPAIPAIPPRPPVVGSVVVETPGMILIGQTRKLSVIVRDVSNNRLTDRHVSFRSSADSIATVDASGMLRAWAVGSVTVTAASEGVTGEATVVVVEPCVPLSPWDYC